MLGGKQHTRILELIHDLTIGKDGVLDDGYLRLARQVKEMIAIELKNIDEKDDFQKSKVQPLKLVNEFIESIDGDMRDTSKYPLMNNLYGQMEAAMSHVLGTNIATKMLDKSNASTSKTFEETRATIQQLLKLEEAPDPHNITYEQKRKLSAEIGASLGVIFASALEVVNKDIKAETKPMYDAYEFMHSAAREAGKELKMRSPFDVTLYYMYKNGLLDMEDGKNISDYSHLLEDKWDFSIEKNKLTYLREIVDGDTAAIPTLMKFQKNSTSQEVIPLHAIDSAILMIAYKMTFQRLKEKGIDIPGSMSVHDAVYSTPEFMLEYRKNYNKAALRVAEYYDLRDETLNTIDNLLYEIRYKEGVVSVIQELEKARENIVESTNKNKNLKIEALKNLEDSGAKVFGTFKMSMPGKPIDGSKQKKPTAQTETVVENEPIVIKKDMEAKEAKTQKVGTNTVVQNKKIKNTKERAKIGKKHLERIKDLFKSKTPYWVIDTETDGPGETGVITEFAARMYIAGKPVGEAIRKTFAPTDMVKYEDFRKKLIKEDTFLPTIGELEFTKDSVRDNNLVKKEMDLILKEMRELSNGELILSGHNIINFDQRVIKESIQNNDIELDMIDTMLIAESFASDAGRGNKTFEKGQYGKGVINQSGLYDSIMPEEMTDEQKENAHSASYDVEFLGKIISIIGKGGKPNFKITEESAVNVEPEIRKALFLEVLSIMSNDKTSKQNNKKKALVALNQLETALNLSEGSEMNQHLETIKAWIQLDGKSKKSKNRLEYNQGTKEITYSERFLGSEKYSLEDLVRYISHEVEHSVTENFIGNQLKENEEKREKSFRFIHSRYKAFKKIMKNPKISAKYKTAKDTFDENVKTRISHIINQNDEYAGVSEFVAIYRSNEAFREMIDTELFNNKESVIKRFVLNVSQLITKAFGGVKDIDLSDITADTLNTAMNNIVLLGIHNDTVSFGREPLQAFTKRRTYEDTLQYAKYKGEAPKYVFQFESTFNTWNVLLRTLIHKGIDVSLDAVRNNAWINEFHEGKMTNTEGIYHRTANVLLERFEPGKLMAKTMGYMNVTEEFDRAAKRKLEALNMQAKEEQNKIDTDMLYKAKELFDKDTKGYSKEQIAAIKSAFDMSIIHVLDEDGSLDKIFDDKITQEERNAEIEKQIKVLEDDLATYKKEDMDDNIYDYSGGFSALATDIAMFYHTRVLGRLASSPVNDVYAFKHTTPKQKASLKKLVALNQLYLMTDVDLETLSEYKNIKPTNGENSYDGMLAISLSNENTSADVDAGTFGEGLDRFENMTGSQISYEERYEIVYVNEKEYRKNLTEDTIEKWITLKKPNLENDEFGVMARKRTDYGFQPGIASASNLNSDGISITDKDIEGIGLKRNLSVLEKNNITRVGKPGSYQHKILLDNEMLSKLEINEHPVSATYRSYGHNIQIYNNISTLQHLLDSEVVYINDREDALKFEKVLKGIRYKDKKEKFDDEEANKDNRKNPKQKPYFVNLAPGLEITDFHELSRQYQSPEHLTNVLGFNQKVNLVHKNLKDEMDGYKDSPLFGTGTESLYYAEKFLRHGVTMFASHVAIANPVKIAGDAMTTASILLANNIPLTSIYKYGKEALNGFPELARLRNDMIGKRFKLFSTVKDSDEYKSALKELNKAQKAIDEHDMSAALHNGFIQSLSTDMMMKDKEAMSDLQKTANVAFGFLEELPYLKASVFKWSNAFGYGIEDVAWLIHRAAPKNKSIELYYEHLDKKMKKIRSEEDFKAYLSELAVVPGSSEVLNIMGGAVLGVDLIGKWIIYKATLDMFEEPIYNKGEYKMTDEQKERYAAELAVNSTINYMTNLPKLFNTLKNVGIFMFPHYTLKIQAVIANLLYNRMIGSGVATATMLISGSFGGHVFAGNLYTKQIPQVSADLNLIGPASII